MKHSTNLVIISGPSGAGEDSVIEGMRERGIMVERVVTSITRPMRKGEVQGKAYYYISLEEFQKLEDNDELIEKAIVYGDKRGVTKKELERVQAQKNKVGTWKIDFKGLVTAKKLFPDIEFSGNIFVRNQHNENILLSLITDLLDAVKERFRKILEKYE